MPQLTKQCLHKVYVYVVFNCSVFSLLWPETMYFPCITRMWLERKPCFQRSVLFLEASVTRSCQTKSITMPSLARNTPICFFFSINNMHPMQCRPYSLLLPFRRMSVCSDSSLDMQVLQASEILKFAFYYTSSYLQQLTTKQVSD